MGDKESIEVGFDAGSMFKTLRFAFSKHDTVVQELLQNSRRAGATRIDITYDPQAKALTVKDNGSGLEDFSPLTWFCVSGWDEATKESEQPYGIGFMATFYAGDRVRFASHGKSVVIESSELLDGLVRGKRFEVTKGEVHEGASVTIEGFEWNNPDHAVGEMVEAYAVEVTYNGKVLERPRAVSQEFRQCEVGQVKFTEAIPSLGTNYTTAIYLQGFCVNRTLQPPKAIVHLDTKQYRGKFPDRSSVIEHERMMEDVLRCMRGEVQKDLLQAKEEMEPLEFCVKRHEQAKSINRLDVFDDIQFVPVKWLKAIEELPCVTEDYERDNSVPNLEGRVVVTRREVESGQVKVALLDDVDAGEAANIALWNLAFAADMVVMKANVGSDHWIHQAATLTFMDEVVARIVGEVPSATQEMRGTAYVDLVPCEEVVYECKGIVAKASTSVWHDGSIYLPKECEVDPRVLRQHQSYRDEWGSLVEHELDSDIEDFRRKAAEAMEPEPSKRVLMQMKSALEGIKCESVGLAFRVEVRAEGLVVEMEGEHDTASA